MRKLINEWLGISIAQTRPKRTILWGLMPLWETGKVRIEVDSKKYNDDEYYQTPLF